MNVDADRLEHHRPQCLGMLPRALPGHSQLADPAAEAEYLRMAHVLLDRAPRFTPGGLAGAVQATRSPSNLPQAPLRTPVLLSTAGERAPGCALGPAGSGLASLG